AGLWAGHGPGLGHRAYQHALAADVLRVGPGATDRAGHRHDHRLDFSAEPADRGDQRRTAGRLGLTVGTVQRLQPGWHDLGRRLVVFTAGLFAGVVGAAVDGRRARRIRQYEWRQPVPDLSY